MTILWCRLPVKYWCAPAAGSVSVKVSSWLIKSRHGGTGTVRSISYNSTISTYCLPSHTFSLTELALLIKNRLDGCVRKEKLSECPLATAHCRQPFIVSCLHEVHQALQVKSQVCLCAIWLASWEHNYCSWIPMSVNERFWQNFA